MHRAVIIGLASLLFAGAPAIADVRDGVDAWSRGDYKKAVDQWRPLANAGDPDAQFNLGQAYSLGRGVPRDIPVAEAWLRKAALQGHILAQAKYGLVLFDQGKHSDAAPWLDKSARQGERRSLLVLGTMLFNGDGVAQDWPRAYALLVRAAALGMPHASEVQAEMDRKIPTEQRQQGLVLAQQYEADAQRAQMPPEITGPAKAAMRDAALPPSRYDPTDAAKPDVVAMQPEHPIRSPASRARPVAPAPSPVVAREQAPMPAVAGRGGWRVQLGAFGDANNAHKLWTQVGARFAGAEVRYVKSGTLTRVLVGGYPTKAAAIAACGAVKPCVPVAP